MSRVAYILAPVEFGGAERVSLNFLEHNDRSRWQITPLIFFRPWEKENIFIHHLDRLKYPYHKIPVAIRSPEVGKDPFRVLRAFNIVHSLLKNGSFDIVHTHGYFADIVGIPVSRWLGIPVVTTCHGYIGSSNKISFLNTYNVADQAIVRFSNRIIAVSESLRDILTGRGIREEKIRVVRNSVNVEDRPSQEERERALIREELNISEEDCLIGFIGRLSHEKGFRYLLEAATLLRKESIPVKLLVLGEGPQLGELVDRSRKQGLNGWCHFLGFQKDIHRWIPAMDVFVLSSLTEGTPMALLEVMSHGKPVVATNVGGVPQIIRNGINGMLVPPGDAHAIRSAILDIISDPGFRRRLNEESLKTVRTQFNLKNWMEEIYGIYDDAIGGA